MREPIRLTFVMTHPVQYVAPWFRHITEQCPELDLTVVYATVPTPEQQGIGFGESFRWDRSLLEGYRYVTARQSLPGASVHSDHFWGLNVAEIPDTVAGTKPDVLLVAGWYSVTLMRAAWAGRRRGIPLLYRGDTQNNPRRRRPAVALWSLKTRLLLRLFDAYLCVGKRNESYLEGFGVPASRIFFAPHCVDNAFFSETAAPFLEPAARIGARRELGIPAGEFVVLYVGKLEEKKRPWDVITASASLDEGVTTLIVGSGPGERQCRQAAAASGKAVVFAGFVNQSQLGRMYAISDCLALPSDFGETWGLVVNEAMACGVPCVVSDRVGCAPDMITPGETGESFAFASISELTAALGRLRSRRVSGHDFAAACRRRVDQYSFAIASRGLRDAARSVLERRKIN